MSFTQLADLLTVNVMWGISSITFSQLPFLCLVFLGDLISLNFFKTEFADNTLCSIFLRVTNYKYNHTARQSGWK